jgi:hypothetical protein
MSNKLTKTRRSLANGIAHQGFRIPDFIVSMDGSGQVPNLLPRLAVQRDRARALLPELLSIDAGLFGSGKESVGGTLASSKPAPPESAEQILAELTAAMDEIQNVTSRIYGKL